MRLVTTVIVLLVLSGMAFFALANGDNTQVNLSSSVIQPAAAAADISEFERAYAMRPLTFPADLGPHPNFQTEWWYYTGNLADGQNNRYGFQLTFFRRALTGQPLKRSSEWGDNQIYFAHFAVTDAANDAFYAQERWSRGGASLAGAQSSPYRVWLDDWQVLETEPGLIHLKATQGNIALDLTLEAIKPVVLQGDHGFSPKSDEPGNASYYYSLTRQQAQGQLTTPAGSASVTGLVWKDHEWSTSALGADAQGWDWFSFQLDDQREVMFFQIRSQMSGAAYMTDGLLIEADGSTRPLAAPEVTLEVLDHWRSPVSQAEYPAKWRFTIPAEKIDLTITPLINNQELNLSVVYWEGAVRIEGSQSGYGYVELTGYSGSMQGRF